MITFAMCGLLQNIARQQEPREGEAAPLDNLFGSSSLASSEVDFRGGRTVEPLALRLERAAEEGLHE